MATDQRSRSFACMLYDDSVLPEWQEYLHDTHIQAFCSPVHTGEKENGEELKPHRHLMLIFEGKKSKSQVQEIFDNIHGVGNKIVHSIRGMARYLCHLDEKDKPHYLPKDVISFGGADYSKYTETETDEATALGSVFSLIKEKKFKYFYQLIDYFCDDPDNIMLIKSNAYTVCEYIKSKRQAWKDEYDYDLQADNKGPAHSNNRARTVLE